ncbi:hypothetical protein BH10PSE15_BH10PSE15_18330 [soil metagenome]
MADTLIAAEHLQGVLFTGHWEAGSSVAEIFEPATGGSLGKIGMADAATIATAAAAARIGTILSPVGAPRTRDTSRR